MLSVSIILFLAISVKNKRRVHLEPDFSHRKLYNIWLCKSLLFRLSSNTKETTHNEMSLIDVIFHTFDFWCMDFELSCIRKVQSQFIADTIEKLKIFL